MPIRPEMKDRYPPNWREVRANILQRAEGRCEWCGAPNYKPHPVTGSKVVLTIAHLDHVPEHCEEANLAALCQKCHNGYDGPMRAAGIRERRAKRAGQLVLPECPQTSQNARETAPGPKLVSGDPPA